MTRSVSAVPHRRRQSYSKAFKAELVAACLKPGASVAAIAMANQVNANLLRRWIKRLQGMRPTSPAAAATMPDPAPVSAPALVPVSVKPPTVAVPSEFHCEVHHRQAVISVTWPTEQAAACALWLRELLR